MEVDVTDWLCIETRRTFAWNYWRQNERQTKKREKHSNDRWFGNWYNGYIPGAPKKHPLKWGTILQFYTVVVHSIIVKFVVWLHYLQNWQNYAAFSHGNLAVETLSKIASTIQDSANAVSANTFLSRDKCL